MQGYALLQPRGYYVVRDGHMLALCRPDGTKAWRFDPAAVLEGDIALAALEDHSELLTMAEEERMRLSQGTATRQCLGLVRSLIERLKHQLLPEVDSGRKQSVT
jgi:hypothetical protein